MMKAQHIASALLIIVAPLLGAQRPGNVVWTWNDAGIRSARNSTVSALVTARALAIVHTCIYDAWAAYDENAGSTQLGAALRRPEVDRTAANKEKAISYAAYRALVDLFPADTDSGFKPLMKQLGYDPGDNSSDIETPAGIGNVVCGAVLEFRHHDKSNQLGDLARGAYSDWTHFRPVNMPSPFPLKLPSTHPIDLNRWQPLIYVDATGNLVAQMFAEAQWCHVTPFALSSGDEFRGVEKDVPPAQYGSPEYRAQAEELINLSATLTDQRKVTVEYWTEEFDAETSVARWNRFAEWISQRDHHSLDDDVKMFFILNNALLDAGIVVSDMKREFNSIRPITAITSLFSGKRIRAWGGPTRE